MWANVLSDNANEQRPEEAVRPLRIALSIAEPGWAERVRSALVLAPGLIVVADPGAPADIVVTDAKPAVPRTSADSPSKCRLTPREREVLELLAAGASNKMIARRLGISIATAKFHVAALLGKLGARGRSDAVAIGVRLGLLML